MANTLITPTIIAQEALFHLENNMIAGDKVHRQYKDEFVKIGDSVTIRKPVKFVVSDGATRVNQDVIETSTSITIDKRKHVSWKFSTQDLTLTIDEYAERYIKPAMISLANQIDEDVLRQGAESFFNIVGTPGTTPADFAVLSNYAKRLDNMAVPDDGKRCLILNPDARWSLANGLGGTGSGGLFNADMVREMTRRGHLGGLATLEIFGDQNVVNHTTGDYSGTLLVNDTVANGDTSVTFDGAGANQAGFLKKGDIVTFAGVFAVNPVSRQTLSHLQEFVITADVTTSGGGATMNVYPEFNDGSTASTAAYQTVSALPADNAAITVKTGAADTAFPQNLAFHENALALVTVPLELPSSIQFKGRATYRGYSIRVVQDYDIDNDEEIIRLDVMYGTAGLYPELGLRATG